LATKSMAEEKKPKIDLKARLGKKTVGGPAGAAVPPPVGLKQSVPVPPLVRAQRPKIDASNPYSAISADQAPARAEPAAIKVEMSAEVVAAQRKGRGKIIALAVVAGVVGGFLGFAVGSGTERGKAAEAAVTGAEDLAKEVDAANAKVEELAEVLKAAQVKIKDNKYPAEEVQKLGGIDIPFAGANLTGKGIGRFKADIVNLLIQFASGAQEANDGKNKVQSILGGAKPAIEDFLAQQTNPKVRWGVLGQHAAVARDVLGQRDRQGQGEELQVARGVQDLPAGPHIHAQASRERRSHQAAEAGRAVHHPRQPFDAERRLPVRSLDQARARAA
jgi:hypothetical protein